MIVGGVKSLPFFYTMFRLMENKMENKMENEKLKMYVKTITFLNIYIK